jgi:thiamine-phosphate pyrophosphorylase
MSDETTSPQIYLITTPLVEAANFAPLLDSALGAIEAACLLLDFDLAHRGDVKKIATELTPLAQRRGAAVLVRDPSYAARIGADGAHLSADESGFEDALNHAAASLKPERVVGVGRLNSKHEAMFAGEAGVDYVMFGDPFADGSRPAFDWIVDRIAWWAEIFTLPCVGYAARLEEAEALAEAGADFIAFGDALWNDPRGPGQALRETMLPLQRKGSRAR